MRRLAALVLALAALAPSAVSAASPSILSPGNTVSVTANACIGPVAQRNWFAITAAVADPSDANRISIASRVIARTPPSTTFATVHVFPLVSTNLNHNTTSLSLARTWRGPASQRTRIVDVVRFIHGNAVVASCNPHQRGLLTNACGDQR